MVNYLFDCYSILNKVYSEKAFLKQAILSTPIEEKNKPLTIKTCYGVLDTDIELSYYIKKLCDKSPKLVVRTILKISMYAIKYLNKHDYAIIKNAVELTKKLGKGGMSGFVNAFLRKFVSTNIALPENKLEYLSIKYSYPLFAVKELIKSYNEEQVEQIISSKNERTCLSFYDIDGEKYLKEKGFTFSKTPFKNVFILDRFTRNEDFDKGIYTFQAIGSVAICSVIDDVENLLDCCSAPGGKSIRLSYKCKNVTSWDIHSHRVELIKEYKTRMKRDNIFESVVDAKIFYKQYEDKFDTVLVDAPCSGLGVTNDNPDIKLNREENSLDELNKEQISILDNVSKYVKVGGNLVYSTCSLLDRENIDIVNQFLTTHKNFAIVKIEIPIDAIDKNGTKQMLPNISMGNGFYVAKLKRLN